MKKLGRSFIAIAVLIALLLSLTISAFAHSGRTDSNGGHKDKKNKSGLGSYHYHCGGYPAHLHSSGYCPYRDTFPSKVTIKAGKKTLGIGETTSVSAAVSPSNACNTSVDWECSDERVVRLSGGTVTAVGYGTAKLTATTFNGKKTTVTITVKEIKAEKVTLSGIPESNTAVYIGDSYDLDATIKPDNVDNPSITWQSSDESIATVDKYGNVRTLKPGKATISAVASNGVAGKYTFNVKEKVVEEIRIRSEDLALKLGDREKLYAEITPEDASFPDVTWTSDNRDVVEIDNTGNIKAVNCGTAVITASSTNGLTDSITVEVTEIIAEKIEINGATSLTLGNTAGYSVVFYPENTTVQDIEWSVSDETVATIDENGNLTPLCDGKVIITVHQKDVEASIDVEINPIPVESIIISTENDATGIDIDETLAFSAVVSPTNATYPEITWSVDNPELAVIDEDGVLTALDNGTVIVTATAADGFSSSFELTIYGMADTVLGLGVLAGIGGGSVAAFKTVKKKITTKKNKA